MNNKTYITIAIVVALLFGGRALASLTLNSTTVAGSGDVVVSSGGTTSATFSVPTGNSLTSNFLNVTGTLPTTLGAQNAGAYVSITGAGTSAQALNALYVILNAGYTGASANRTAGFFNTSAGTGTAGFTGGASNQGIVANATGVTTGNNVGNASQAQGSSSLNLGLAGRAVAATNSPALNVGTNGLALNATTNVGGFFGLMSTAPTLSSSAALIADNGATTSDIFVARDNGTPVLTVADGGATSLTGVLTAASGTAATAGGAPAFKLGSSGTLGIYYGSGVPTISAAQGSLYMRTDGNSTSTRMYVNTDGGTTWTAVTTAL